jgi:hypothetical protein
VAYNVQSDVVERMLVGGTVQLGASHALKVAAERHGVVNLLYSLKVRRAYARAVVRVAAPLAAARSLALSLSRSLAVRSLPSRGRARAAARSRAPAARAPRLVARS